MFELKESKEIELLNVNAQIYQHSQFETQHIHLDSPNDEKVFMVAFRTIPEDSTGGLIFWNILLCADLRNTLSAIHFL